MKAGAEAPASLSRQPLREKGCMDTRTDDIMVGTEAMTDKRAEEKARDTMFCPVCGKQVRDDSKFCSGCGTDLKALLGEKDAGRKETAHEEPRDMRYPDSDRGDAGRYEDRYDDRYEAPCPYPRLPLP